MAGYNPTSKKMVLELDDLDTIMKNLNQIMDKSLHGKPAPQHMLFSICVAAGLDDSLLREMTRCQLSVND